MVNAIIFHSSGDGFYLSDRTGLCVFQVHVFTLRLFNGQHVRALLHLIHKYALNEGRGGNANNEADLPLMVVKSH